MRSIRNMLKMALAVAALSLATGQQCWAVFGDFTYSTVVTPATINPSATVGGPGSQVTQGSEAPPTTINAALLTGTDVVVGTITVTDLGVVVGPYTDTYGPTAINVKVSIVDQASGQTLTFNFAGTLTGMVGSNGTTDAVVFNNPFAAASQSQTTVFGVNSAKYTVSIIPSKDFTAPGAPPIGGPGLNGTYSFHVFATPVVPEPASLTLLGIGVLGTLGIAVRRRRAR
jgi:hypothetical protein